MNLIGTANSKKNYFEIYLAQKIMIKKDNLSE